MTAILRYALLKSWREQLVAALILAPTVMAMMPLVGASAFHVSKGRAFYPLTMDPRMTPEATATMFCHAVLLLSTGVAGTAAFRVFRSEVAGKGVAFFYLASAPRMVVAASTIYGAAIGSAAFLVWTLFGSALAGSLPAALGQHVLIAFVSAIAASALGALMVRISTDFAMLIPVYAGGLAVSMSLLKRTDFATIGLAVGISAILIAVSHMVWGRRCAV